MNFHWCGNPLHDLMHNLVMLLAMAPEWMPFVAHWARAKLNEEHVHG